MRSEEAGGEQGWSQGMPADHGAVHHSGTHMFISRNVGPRSRFHSGRGAPLRRRCSTWDARSPAPNRCASGLTRVLSSRYWSCPGEGEGAVASN